MTVDARTLTVDLGINMNKRDWDLLTMHNTLRKGTRRACDVLISMINNDQYMVVPTS